jgi:hypothetical protein
MNSIETKLHVEIDDELEKLVDIEVGTEQHKAAVDDIAKLTDKALEMERLIQNDKDLRLREKEQELRLKQMEADERDRLIKNGLTATGIIVSAGLTIWGTIVSIDFEKTGTFTTIMGKGFIHGMLPKK